MLAVLGVIVGGLALFAAFVGLERVLRRPGLTFLLASLCGALAAALGFSRGHRMLPAFQLVQALAFFYFAHWRHTTARAEAERARET